MPRRTTPLGPADLFELVQVLGGAEAVLSSSRAQLLEHPAAAERGLGHRAVRQVYTWALAMREMGAPSVQCRPEQDPPTLTDSASPASGGRQPGEAMTALDEVEDESSALLPPPATVTAGGLRRQAFVVLRNADDEPRAVVVGVRRGTVEIPWETYAWLRKAYSRWTGKGAPLAEVADKLRVTPKVAEEIMRALRLTHWSAPLPDHRIAEEDLDGLAEELAADRRADLFQRLQRKEHRDLQRDALSWRRFEAAAQGLVAEALAGTAARRSVRTRPMRAARRPWSLVTYLADVHVGKYGSEEVCGDAAASIERCRQDLLTAIDDLLVRVHGHGRPDGIELVIGGDWFQTDTSIGTTTRGTPQATDGNPDDELRAGLELGTDAIERFREVGVPVRVWVVPGNHDRRTLTMAGLAWQFWYRDCDDVEVRVCRADRTYAAVGQTLLILQHGDGAKAGDLAALSMHEARPLAGRTQHTLALIGHWHHSKRLDATIGGRQRVQMVDERGVQVQRFPERFGGVSVEQQPTIAGEDDWHASNGYAGARRAICGYLVDLERGPVGRILGLPAVYGEVA